MNDNEIRTLNTVPERSIPLYLVLSIVTCGLFGIYWFICIVDDLNRATGSESELSGGIVFLLCLVTCGIYGIYWYYKAGQKVNMLKGVHDDTTPILYLILALFELSIINMCLIQNELNEKNRRY